MNPIRVIKRIYGAGWRAGRAEAQVVKDLDGTSWLLTPECPYKGFWGFIPMLIWWDGWHAGMTQKLSMPIRRSA